MGLIHKFDAPGFHQILWQVAQQRRLTGTGDTRDGREHARGDVHVHVLQVVSHRIADLQRVLGGAQFLLQVHGVREVLARESVSLA